MTAPRLCLLLGVVLTVGAVGSVVAHEPTSHPEGPRFYSIAQFGAVADGKTRNTIQIQRAIDAASSAGGGTVWIPAGRYLTGTLVLKDNVTLHLDNGAVLLGSTDARDYPPHQPAYRSWTDTYVNMSLLYAEKVHDIAITGAGMIDGQGGDPAFACKRPDFRFLQRPYLIRVVECTKVHVAGITLRDSAMWVQHYLACDNLTLEGLTVVSNCNFNNDMMDIDGCRDVRVSGCTGESGDDAITLKATGLRPCERVTISDCTVASHCSGIKLGTESTGGFRDITITNCVVRHPTLDGLCKGEPEGIGLETVDGGTLERVILSNITVDGAEAPIFLRLGNRARKHTPDASSPGVGTLRDVVISNLVARNAGTFGCPITGLPDFPIENVTLRDIQITCRGGGTADDAARKVDEKPDAYPACRMFGQLPAYGFYARHVKGLTLDNVRVGFEKSDRRPALICEDVSGLNICNLQAGAAKDGAEAIRLDNVRSALIRGCIAPENAATFLLLTGKCDGISVIGNDLSRASQAFRTQGERQDRTLFQAANRMPDNQQ